MAILDLKPQVTFGAGIVFKIAKNEAGELVVVVSGGPFDSLLALASMTELVIPTDNTDLSKLRNLCNLGMNLQSLSV